MQTHQVWFLNWVHVDPFDFKVGSGSLAKSRLCKPTMSSSKLEPEQNLKLANVGLDPK